MKVLGNPLNIFKNVKKENNQSFYPSHRNYASEGQNNWWMEVSLYGNFAATNEEEMKNLQTTILQPLT